MANLTKQAFNYKAKGLNRLQVSEFLAGGLSLYGKMFFGHKATPKDKVKIKAINKAVNTAFN